MGDVLFDAWVWVGVLKKGRWFFVLSLIRVAISLASSNDFRSSGVIFYKSNKTNILDEVSILTDVL